MAGLYATAAGSSRRPEIVDVAVHPADPQLQPGAQGAHLARVRRAPHRRRRVRPETYAEDGPAAEVAPGRAGRRQAPRVARGPAQQLPAQPGPAQLAPTLGQLPHEARVAVDLARPD